VDALTQGIASAGATAVLAGVLPTPAVALLAEDLGAVVSASHNPPEYNGVKIFDGEGRKLTDSQEEEIEALLDAGAPGGGSVERLEGASTSYLRPRLRHGPDGLRSPSTARTAPSRRSRPACSSVSEPR
jgi:phosphomannomutase